ncbi:hypothetical protein M409DRAFT_71620 [Zasmidium cellare ATCC 36951]|uniref:Probable endonuclease LCL3 n=1 Tax=Zasmidium cellare ATCC 36951 TaxID=1080233 RepID=A0A6A6BUN4_ZASCE|nr:uncharacterized protein M409DRAFT_71620 [Zasmidium cellare ATCC 36951]KAF2158504.1 hypothetical protein M409DRAFT_71620 [Zasmidium cellare ATCC 36951]
MPWRFWAKADPPPDDKQQTRQNETHSPPSTPITTSSSPSRFTPSQTVAFSLVTTGTALGLIRIYKTRLRRIPTIAHLKPTHFRTRSLYGYVTRVGDGDNFHFFHTPGGRWTGWGWMRGISKGKELKGKTLHVRLAGVDAPEMAHFGRPEQPFGREALEWLRGAVLHRYVRVRPWRRDQYERVVCTVYRRKWLVWKTDVGLEMIKRGLATVYEAKFGSEFGGKKEAYAQAEEEAKRKRIGMWQKPGLLGKLMGRKESSESPREYKTRMTAQEEAAK